MSKPLVLVDGSSYLYRAYHALPPLTNVNGQPTGAIYGVVNMLRKLVHEVNPTHVAVVFDAKGKTFRHDIYPEYKAHRPPMPDDLRVQVEPLHQIVQAMGLPLVMVSGVEADDVIGTLAQAAEGEGMPVLISTGDKDMAQLVTDHITLVNTMNNSFMNPDGVMEKFGVRPNQIIDYLALMGDTVDNVPGVPKVGPKTAQKWLAEYDSLENIIKNANQIKGKIGENLRASIDTLPLSKQLVTIKTDVDLTVGVEELTPKKPDTESLRTLFHTLSFKSWLSELDNAKPEHKPSTYEAVLDAKLLNEWVKAIEAEKLVAIDTETTSLSPIEATLVGISLATPKKGACYIPVGHQDVPEQLPCETVLDALKPLLTNTQITKVAQNLKYDLNVFKKYNVEITGSCYDTMLESYMNNSVGHRHDLDTLAQEYCAHTMIKFEDVAGKGKKQITFDEVALDKATQYAAEDADYTLKIHQALWPQLEEKPGPCKVFQTLEMPLVPILAEMEYTGVLVDADVLKQQSDTLGKKLEQLQEKIYKSSGEPFNIDSPKQLQWVLFDKMGLPIVSKTPTGQPSTAEPVLQELAQTYELPSLIVEYRSLSKLKSTYTDKLPLQIKDETGRVHTSYNQTVTATGRLSSSDPNLQNIPIRTDNGRAIRKAFIAPSGYLIAAIDYSQIELRIMAHLSKDKTLQQAFHDDLDIHAATASEVFGVPVKDVTSEERRRAKAINFGLIYGMSAFGLAKQIGVSRDEAQHYIDVYFNRYPGVKKYMDDTRAWAAKQGYVETLSGRRLYLPDINASNKMLRAAAERTAINAPMQGTAADIIKQAMINVSHYLTQSQADARMVMQVHDELVFEVSMSDTQAIVDKLVDCMQSAMQLSVPLIATAGIGNNWDEAH